MRRSVLGFLVAAVVIGYLPSPALAQPVGSGSRPTVLLVVDTSGSMAGAKLDQAKVALNAAIDALASDQAAGLQSFAGDCGNRGVLEVEIGDSNRDALRTSVAGLAAGGGTPTPDALRGAAEHLSGVGGRRTVVLVSDGESTCGDPCPVAQEIKNELGIDFKVHTVGFQAPSEAEDELACIADATGGNYLSAEDQDGLSQAVSQAVRDGYCRGPLDFDISTPEGIADLLRPVGGLVLPFTDSAGNPICLDYGLAENDQLLEFLQSNVIDAQRLCDQARVAAGAGLASTAVFLGGLVALGGGYLSGGLETATGFLHQFGQDLVLTGADLAQLAKCEELARAQELLAEYLRQ